MIDISEVTSQVQVSTTVTLSGAEPVQVKYTIPIRFLNPEQVRIEYSLSDDGEWVRRYIRIHGLRILKPAADGTMRLGKEQHHRDWYHYDKDVPDWIQALVNEMRPFGNPQTAGDLS